MSAVVVIEGSRLGVRCGGIDTKGKDMDTQRDNIATLYLLGAN